jgi:hypothetical protein
MGRNCYQWGVTWGTNRLRDYTRLPARLEDRACPLYPHLSRLAVESKFFPLYEVGNGEKWTITVWPKREVPVREYLKLRGRFSHLTEEDIEFIQENVDRGWERLVGRAGE